MVRVAQPEKFTSTAHTTVEQSASAPTHHLAAIPLHTADQHATIASDTLKHSNDAEKETGEDPYTKIKEMALNAPLSACRLKFDLIKVGVAGAAFAKIYKNGVAIGTERTATETYVTHSEDFTDWLKDDLIQIYARMPSPSTMTPKVKNMRICYTEATERVAPTNQDP